ncbi:CheR family methyltransferase [Telmatospirillum siberiense]|uniref:Chemotaxis protein methyltransferase n=1 Tax=Telmatospirillum siberiense TaxID=382514 RepID=A0A2N3PX72_9PROT|nr:protein-glutamate O-methyltransferase [Telmatospirillum siberiense]PKU24999.1 chemotaxis protein CheR [Telmatospirillum siberiense]
MSGSTGSGIDRLSTSDFRRLASFIENYSGIKMSSNKRTMVEGRLRKRARALGLESLSEYCRTLFEDGGMVGEAINLIDAVTTNKTDFFREIPHFQFLADHVLPQLAGGDIRIGIDVPLKVWSAACSTGAEPYSLAMMLEEFGRQIRGFRFSVLATDICTEVLAIAREAIYPETMIAPIPDALRRSCLRRSRDKDRSLVRISPALRGKVSFGRLNLMDDSYPVDKDMDVIFCRNILIYFDRPTQEAVVRRLVGHLKPGGYLFVGHTESMAGFTLPLRPVASSVFQKR